MSVPKYKRQQPKFELINKATAITAYTLKMCSNEKIFPKRFPTSVGSYANWSPCLSQVLYRKAMWMNATKRGKLMPNKATPTTLS